MKVTPIIGLEVHVELKTKSKMFCGCDASHFHAQPNTHTCPVCLGLPGALPVPNKTACEWCIKLGLALGCTINEESFFERKNYFYPDLAKSYQITQLQKPFAINGKLDIDGHIIRINRAHQEEDTGKSVHMNLFGEDSTLLDFNRSGVPLVEIVSEPDLKSAAEAKKYLEKLQQLIRYIGVSDADIEKGSMRCEPTINICIEDNGQKFYTPLAEIKNVASLTGVMNAINYEIDRQTKQFADDHQEKNSTNKTTRGWDAEKNHTFLQREKEGSADYRYFPEPDIPPIVFTKAQIEAIRATIPELPEVKIDRYTEIYMLSEETANTIASNSRIAEAYDKIINAYKNIPDINDFAKFVANLFIGPIFTYINECGISEVKISFESSHFLELYSDFKKGEISSSTVKIAIVESVKNGTRPSEFITKNSLKQVSNIGALEEIVKKVLVDNPKAVTDYQKNPLSIGFLVGQVMKLSAGSANPQLAKEVLEKLLK